MFDRTGPSGLSRLLLPFLPLALAGLGSSAPTRTLFAGPSALQDRPLVPIAKSGVAGRMAARTPDTLEISAFLVEFLKESPNNTFTTGDGTFGSDSSGKTPIESFRARRDSTRAHYLRVFQGVSEYWRTVSGGNLEVEFRVFPEASGAKPYALPRTMGQYSPIKGAKETSAHFDSLYTVRILEMLSDAVRKAAADAQGPFAQAKPASIHRHRSYLMVHAGASRSTDGGEKGSAGANTAADIGDFSVGPTDFKYLGIRGMVRDTAAYLKDTSGIAIGATGIDTLKNLLVVAETATQDGMNWGIRGTVANLVGRALGIPDLYDVARGLSVVGQFDLMDAGSMGGRNSVPTMLSAWPRLFMGWATAIEATPSGKTKFDLPAIRPGHDTVLVVRINDGEYLLVENRQRTADGSKLAWVKFGNLLGTDSTTYSVPPDSLDSLLRDPKKAVGYVLGSSPDAALPGSGLLVWHVNEWLLKELVRGGTPNAYLGDTLSDRYKGLTLVQASGKQTLGHPFTGITGQTTSDAGSGSDMLPFAWRHGKTTDTITAIGPEGYASTGSLLGGRSLVTLRAPWPQGALPQGGRSSLEGDSVWTPGARSISVTLDWGALRSTTDSFPRRTTPAWGDQAILPGPASLPKSVLVIDTNGRASLFDSTGAHWFAAKDSAKLVSAWDSTPTLVSNRTQLDTTVVALDKLGATMSNPVQTALQADTLALRDRTGRVWLKWPAADAFLASHRDSARFLDTVFSANASAGPVLAAGKFWLGDSSGRLRSATPSALGTTVATGLGRIQSICATVRAGHAALAAVDTTGAAVIHDPSGNATTLRSSAFVPAKGEAFQILSSDFDRDGIADIAVIGSFGNAILWSGANNATFPGWPKRFARGAGGVGEPGAAALADLNGDGRPDLVFGGTDRVYAVDASGIPLAGWPVAIVNNASVGQATSNRTYPAGILGASPLVADLDGNGGIEVVAGTVDGQILAWTGSGKSYGGAALSRTVGSAVAPTYRQTTWPLAAGGQILDSSRPPYLPVAFPTGKADRLLALSSLSSLDGFRLTGGKSVWPLAFGGAGRGAYLPDSLIGAVVARKTGITDFHLFPSPVRKGTATFRYELGQDASSAKLTVYDQTGFQVLDQSGLPAAAGRQELALRDLAWGTGVYAARLSIKWAAGGSNEAWVRFGVVR